ncbi:hypothetical protein NBRC116587_30870 [Pseudoteredinibacter isoporae]
MQAYCGIVGKVVKPRENVGGYCVKFERPVFTDPVFIKLRNRNRNAHYRVMAKSRDKTVNGAHIEFYDRRLQ